MALNRKACTGFVMTLTLASFAIARQDATEIIRATGVRAGLAVHVGTTDGQLEIGLTNEGKILVHGLSLNGSAVDRARAAITAGGLYGLSSVERVSSFKRLPYADNLVNLLVADLDRLGDDAPSRGEILRVLVPRGIAYLNESGNWTKTFKRRPTEMDEWTHFDYGPEGNGVSHDKLVRQPNFIQWISGVQPIKLGGNPAGFINLTGIRVAGGRVFFDTIDTSKRGRERQSVLHGRDSFNGVPLWSRPRDGRAGGKRWQLVAVGDRLYTALDEDGPLVALDAATGEIARSFDEAGALRSGVSREDRFGINRTQLRVAGGKLAVNVNDALRVLDVRTGDLLWEYEDPLGRKVLWPSMSVEADRIFAAVRTPQAVEYYGRWPYSDVDAVLCWELSSGKRVWENTEVAGKPIGQLVYHDGNLALFCGSAISGRGAKQGGGWVSNITVADGKLHGENTFQVRWNTSMYNAIVRDDAIWYAGHTTIYRADLETAEIVPAMNLSYNQRCNRFCATDDLFITGYVTYLDRQFNGTLLSVARAGCALGATPANGMVYFTPSACRCFTQLRGYMAMSPEPIREPLPDDRRLERGGGKPARLSTPGNVASSPSGPIGEDWLRQPQITARETTPVLAGKLQIVAAIHEHRVEARDPGGETVWAFIAGGRVSGRPLVQNGVVYFGSHDGWVYALKVADGSLLWRYMVAPYARKMVAYGQLESSWPIYGVILHDGLICASAGLHPEIGGGVYVCGLDPKTGKAVFRRRLFKPAARITMAEKRKATGNIVPHSFLNAPLQSETGRLKIGNFVFSPGESDSELQERLNTKPEKKKR